MIRAEAVRIVREQLIPSLRGSGGHEYIAALEALVEPGSFGSEPQPRIADRCPACGGSSLFVGAEGWLTCAVLKCPTPSPSAHWSQVGAALDDLQGKIVAQTIEHEAKNRPESVIGRIVALRGMLERVR